MNTLLSPEYIDKSNNLGRLFRWRQAFVNVMGHPLLGSGLGTFGGSAAQKYGYFTGISMDSVWIRVLAETGILGFVSYVAWFASAFASVAARYFRTRHRLWLFTSIGLLALLVNLFTDNLLDSWAISLLAWSLFALGPFRSHRHEGSRSQHQRLPLLSQPQTALLHGGSPNAATMFCTSRRR